MNRATGPCLRWNITDVVLKVQKPKEKKEELVARYGTLN